MPRIPLKRGPLTLFKCYSQVNFKIAEAFFCRVYMTKNESPICGGGRYKIFGFYFWRKEMKRRQREKRKMIV